MTRPSARSFVVAGLGVATTALAHTVAAGAAPSRTAVAVAAVGAWWVHDLATRRRTPSAGAVAAWLLAVQGFAHLVFSTLGAHAVMAVTPAMDDAAMQSMGHVMAAPAPVPHLVVDPGLHGHGRAMVVAHVVAALFHLALVRTGACCLAVAAVCVTRVAHLLLPRGATALPVTRVACSSTRRTAPVVAPRLCRPRFLEGFEAVVHRGPPVAC